MSFAVLALGCVKSRTEACGDDIVCGDGTTCLDLPAFDVHACVSQAQRDLCAGIADGTPCDLDPSEPAVAPGTCFGEACHPALCGDKIIDVTEVCDDGNRESDDGCSSTCTSTEKCGDNIVDFAQQEQCDDGGGLSGDGCSSTCKTEFPIWRDVTPGLEPPAENGTVMVTGLDGSVARMGGTLGPSAGTGNPSTGDIWTYDGASWLPISTLGQQPPTRTGFAVAHDPIKNHVLLFGGVASDGTTVLGDLWEWDGLRWIKRTPTGVAPTARRAAGFACTKMRCVLFGGSTSTGDGGELNDAWQWDGSSWTQITFSGPPTQRKSAVWIADVDRDVFDLVGGNAGSSIVRSDAWELEPTRWIQTANSGTFIQSLVSGAYDETLHRPMVVMGQQTWTFSNPTWSNQVQSPAPLNLADLAYSPIAGRVIGFSSSMMQPGVVTPWVFETSTSPPSWSAKAPRVPNDGAAGPAGGPSRTIAAYDAKRARTIVVDAATGSGSSAGTWEWNGIGWRRTLVTGPAASSGGALAYDPECNTTIQHGGQSSPYLANLWTHDGAKWTAGPTAPVARAFHAMTFDEARGALVVFGGLTGAGPDQTTYEWRGACGQKAWANASPLAPAMSPPKRSNATLAYDAKRKVSVLFGGTDGATELGDTWEWNGTTWTNRMPTEAPPARQGHAMAWDPLRQHVVLVGGRSSGVRRDDTWEWDGNLGAWHRVPTIVTTAARYGAALARDPGGGLIMIGGFSTGALTTVDRLRYERGVEPTERCLLATDDADGDLLAGCADPDCWARCNPYCAPGTSCTAKHCGDNICEAPEDYLLCPGDCPVPP